MQDPEEIKAFPNSGTAENQISGDIQSSKISVSPFDDARFEDSFSKMLLDDIAVSLAP